MICHLDLFNSVSRFSLSVMLLSSSTEIIKKTTCDGSVAKNLQLIFIYSETMSGVREVKPHPCATSCVENKHSFK